MLIVLLAGVEDAEHVVAFDALRILLKLFLDLLFGFFDAALAEKLLRFLETRIDGCCRTRSILLNWRLLSQRAVSVKKNGSERQNTGHEAVFLQVRISKAVHRFGHFRSKTFLELMKCSQFSISKAC